MVRTGSFVSERAPSSYRIFCDVNELERTHPSLYVWGHMYITSRSIQHTHTLNILGFCTKKGGHLGLEEQEEGRARNPPSSIRMAC